MARRRRVLARTLVLTVILLTLSPAAARAQHGVAFSGEGAINRSMGGAATAAPIDATGALYWNPASISAFQRSEMEVGIESLYPQTRLSSSLGAGSLAPGFPPVGLSGSDVGDNHWFLMPSVGLVYVPENSKWTFGLGTFIVGGFGTNYPGSTTNPILSPPPPAGVGVGPIYSQFETLQIVPTVAYQLTDKLSIGVGPSLSFAQLQLDPGIAVPPNPPNAFGVRTYPSLTHTGWAVGAGFQAGIFYKLNSDWSFGASYKSPQWFEPFEYNSQDQFGRPRTDRVHADYPQIFSTGIAYSGFERWLLAADFRYIDYHNTRGFEDRGFDATGALSGLGWRSIFALAVGAQYQMTDRLSVRAGYSFNQNPVPADLAGVNIATAVIPQHTVYTGFSYRCSDNFLLSLAYYHVFDNSITGPMLTPQGPIPGSQVRDQVSSADAVILGLTVQFGGRCCQRHPQP